jgi:ribonucleoside-diphosphate reductase alpha chain
MSSGLLINRRFTTMGTAVEDTVKWSTRRAEIKGSDSKVIFEQDNCLFPESWSDQAVNVVASKYFYKGDSDYPKEHSVMSMIRRVVNKITNWGLADGHFADQTGSEKFADELTYILLHQMGSFNSPVWFNLGVPNRSQQASACFIQSVDDSMESIIDFVSREAIIFKGGSGSGTNVSRIRALNEPLSTGGKASGPISFMRGIDNLAGAIKSGGTTRRAAKMVCMDADHPDIEAFINCKKDEELKAHALIEAGYDGGFNVTGGAYDTVSFQNANHSVRVTDEFMRRASGSEDAPWYPRERVSGKYREALSAREILHQISEATWVCGDPGMQYDDTINRMHTCSFTDRIYASNPCSEYMFLDDTACNLASINLLKFLNKDGSFNVDDYVHVCEIFIIAMDIIVGNADYPTEKIKQMSHEYRTLGLGFCNLGSLLMVKGLAYDSDEGRSFAGVITSILSAAGYRQSARMATVLGPFKGHSANKYSMAAVLAAHRNSSHQLQADPTINYMLTAANHLWEDAMVWGKGAGYRNAQISVLAPTGTIAFMMDAGTTGIEPDIALVKYKMLVGGGMFKMVNPNVEQALVNLGYEDEDLRDILKHVEETDTIENCPWLLDEHLEIFDCAFKAQNGTRYISSEGHLKMMAACQPFISGAISKTVNMPTDCTVEDIMDVYIKAWEMGIKAVAIYRDGSKKTQPLNTYDTDKAAKDKLNLKPGIESLKDKLKGAKLFLEGQQVDEGLTPIGQALLAGSVVKTRHGVVGILEKDTPLSDLVPPLNPEEAAIKFVTRESYDGSRIDNVPLLQKPYRRKLSNDRIAKTHKFSIAGHEGYITVGLYDDGSPGEVFIKMNKEGSTISGLMDSVAIMLSMSLQYGVPLQTLVDKFKHTRFEPSGYTTNPGIRSTSSIMDYVVQYLEQNFLSPENVPQKLNIASTVDKNLDKAEHTVTPLRGRALSIKLDVDPPEGFLKKNASNKTFSEALGERIAHLPQMDRTKLLQGNWDSEKEDQWAPEGYATIASPGKPSGQMDAPPCSSCGSIMQRAGSCYKCPNCGNTTGCA